MVALIASAGISMVTSPRSAFASPPTVSVPEVISPLPAIEAGSSSSAPVPAFCINPVPATSGFSITAVTASSDIVISPALSMVASPFNVRS